MRLRMNVPHRQGESGFQTQIIHSDVALRPRTRRVGRSSPSDPVQPGRHPPSVAGDVLQRKPLNAKPFRTVEA